MGAYYLIVRSTLPNLNLYLCKWNLINVSEKTTLAMADPDGHAV